MKNLISGAFDKINELFTRLFETIMLLLPTSPFHNIELNSTFIDFLGYFNYYVPMSTLLAIMVSWLSCIITYYAYQLLLRNIKAVS